jgi:DNA invertase Pin-like site-specific DNA recombinase
MPGQSAKSAKKRLRLVGYLRVSTSGQVADGLGLDIQESAIRSWCKEHDHRLVGFHSDEGVSGTTDERDGLQEALAAVRFNGADGLVVHTLDRLARRLDVQEAALQSIWASGGRAFTVDQGEALEDDPDDPVRTFVRQVLGAVSQLEAGMIVRRLRRGREAKAERGGYAFGAPPFGFRAEDGALVEDPDEQTVISRMVALRGDGMSLRQIAGVLNESGLSPKRSGAWHPMMVKRVLDRVAHGG